MKVGVENVNHRNVGSMLATLKNGATTEMTTVTKAKIIYLLGRMSM